MSEKTQEIPIYPVSQVPAKTTGPVGRLTDIQNMDVEHYVPSEGGPRRMKLSQRHAFVSLSTVTHDPSTGAPNSLSWSNPEILSSLGKQPVSVCNSIPRVFSGVDFTGYSDKRVCTGKFTQSVFHTSDSTEQVPDNATIDNVTCAVWTETTLKNGIPYTISKIGFKAENGAWIIAPKTLQDFGTDVTDNVSMARVCADGDGERFWVVYNSFDNIDLVRVLAIKVYDTDGELLAASQLAQNSADPGPGFWDIAPRTQGGIMIVQPGAVPAGGDTHVQTSKVTYSAGVVTVVSVVDTNIHSSGPVAIVSNELDAKTYIGTWDGAASLNAIFGYQVDNITLLKTHEFDYLTTASRPDSIIGYTEDSGVVGQPSLVLGWTTLPTSAASSGPEFDPALRKSEVYRNNWANSALTKLKQVNSLCFVSRAFKHDGEWYAIMYYQSGSGLTITGAQIDVSWTSGDYMIGAPIQKIPVAVGDLVTGSVQNFTTAGGPPIIVNTATVGSSGIGAGDKVEYISPGPFDGSPVLKWTFAGMSVDNPTIAGARLVVAGSSIPTANKTWDIVGADITSPGANFVYTQIVAAGGGTVIPGTFGASGTKQVIGMTFYRIDLPSVFTDQTATRLLNGSTVDITGNSTSANNGIKTIARAIAIPQSVFAQTAKYQYPPGIWIVTGSETSSAGTFNAAVSPISPQNWEFPSLHFFGNVLKDVGPHTLIVSGSQFDVNGAIGSNDGEREITNVPANNIITTDGFLLSQIFSDPLPSISISVPLDVTPYTFKLQSVTVSYNLIGAIIVVQDAIAPSNDGGYKVTGVDPVNGLIFADSVDGRTDQFSESFSNSVTITILLSDAIKPVFQPKWFMTPLRSGLTTAHVGRFDDGLAYADWRIEGDQDLPSNMFSLGVTSVPARTLGKQFILPYRAKSFTAGQPLVSPQGQVLVDVTQTLFESSVGLKTFILNNSPALPFEATNETVLPGPMTSVFTQSGFNEQGISVSPEAPFVVSQGTVSDGTFITPGTTHQYQVVYRITLENGDTVLSPPSPALDVKLIGTNNKNVVGGRLPIPLNSSGVPVSAHFGLTNYRIVGIIVTRTAYRNATPTIQHFEITNPLNPNALAAISSLNESGFSFPDEFTWHYTDANPDVDILESEILYTDKGYLPRFPARPSNGGCIWRGRQFMACDDGSVQMSGEKTEGDDYWHFPAYRWTFGNDRAVNCQPMGNYLIVGCERSFWYIPAPGAFPDAGGRNGSIPDAVEITKVTHGCLGPMCQVNGGVAYASSVGGIWAINSTFESVWISINYKDDLNLKKDSVYALAVDNAQKLYCVTNTATMYVYDQIVKTWMKYILPSVNGTLLAIVDGVVHYQDNHRVFEFDNTSFADNIDGDLFGINWKLVFAYMSFGPVRAYKFCREFQLLGEYKGDHREKVTLSYPEQKWQPDTVFGPTAVNPLDDFLVAFSPMLEDASVFGLIIEADFVGVNVPGNSAEIELLSAEIGLESNSMLQTTRRL